ncbi:MAG: radical SAM protein [Armatimonadota bacterium]
MEGTIIATYRCNGRCHICNSWQVPASEIREMDIKYYERFPRMSLLSITGGEPFIREDMPDIIRILHPKCNRILISTNGYYTERIVAMAKKYKDIAFRVSMEGLPRVNDELRGIKDGFDHALRTIIMLKEAGAGDVGINITVTDKNYKDLMELYTLSKQLGVQFSAGIAHNGYAYRKFDNKIIQNDSICEAFRQLVAAQLKNKRPKDWFRAYINHGIINHINGGKRLLPCVMGHNKFLCEPWGDIKPCNMMDETIGNITENPFEKIWHSRRASDVRKMVENCDKRCWLPYNASQIMSKRLWIPMMWILRNKWRRKIAI